MERIAIIPARSGSKGLPDKNIKTINGKPLMAWSILAAKDSGLFDEIMVSTDSEEYKDIAMEFGANVPFLRNADTSTDVASTWDAVREVIVNYEERYDQSFDTVCLLQPTSPLRTSKDGINAFQIFEEKKADAVVSVCKLEHAIKTINTLPVDGCMDGFLDSRSNARRQDAGEYYRLNGAIYIQKVSLLLKGENIYGPKSFAYIMDKAHSVDIDDINDFRMADFLMSSRIT